MSASNLFTFDLPRVPNNNSVEVLSFDEYYEMAIADMPLPQFPPRTMAQLVALVDQGKASEISVLEWLDIIENDHHWQGLDKDQEFDASRAIWLAICTNGVLGNIAFFKAGLAVEGQPTTMVKPLLDSMDIVSSVPGLNVITQQKIGWIAAIKESDWLGLAKQCYVNKQSPVHWVKKLMMPNANYYVDNLGKYLIDCSPVTLTGDDQTWLESCFHSLKTTQQRVEYCQKLLAKYSANLGNGIVKSLIEEHCLPNSEHSFWYYFDQPSIDRLKTLFKLSDYYELKSLVTQLCSDECSAQLNITEQQIKQMRGRTDFWSNYSTRFDRIRVLLPQKSHDVLTEAGVRLTSQVDVYKNNDPLNVEVFIFALGKLIVVEVLRGELGETRFYKNNKWNAERLFSGSFNSIAEIRELAQVEVHDHVLAWQYFCEKLLRTKFKVLPNENTSAFKGMSRKFGQYSTKTGLPKPDTLALNDRARMLEEWLEKFWSFEFQTTKYSTTPASKESTQTLAKAQVQNQLGDDESYKELLSVASKQGNTEAMYRYGVALVKGTNSERKEGERNILKSAQKGHKSAEDFIQKFGISEYAEMRPIFKDSLKKINASEKIWIGFHMQRGWVELDRTLKENRPESNGTMIFVELQAGKMFFEEKSRWKEPLFIFGPNYIDSASDTQLKELEVILTRYKVKLR
ncbi:EH signature domain-containing protein [Vibrio genomosp. F10]|uniref:EH signature domain-containing protein n=1 Tax=Vibrio genomosp. F10 TaxID=723171 RepID=UPI0002FCE817|nr:EH signature domain-containing protein [Vibrio genomosp. F10]OEE84643.1 hypothetical protein A1QK_03955 [Vibrio genomosp. F10 str. 9ZD137]